LALPRLPSRRKLRYLFMGAARSPREAILDLLGYDPTRRLADRRIGKWADAIAWLASVTLVVSVALFREPTSAWQCAWETLRVAVDAPCCRPGSS
jgi:hypothetical protein